MVLQLYKTTNIELVEGKFLLTRYFPAAPVQNSLAVGNNIPNGGAESYVELAKAINTLGDTRLSLGTNSLKWALNPASATLAAGAHTILPEFDYDTALIAFKTSGAPVLKTVATDTNASAGDVGSTCFAMAVDLETSNGLEISGLNAEEQSDISLIARFSATQNADFNFEVFTHIDSMIVLKENNVLELIQ